MRLPQLDSARAVNPGLTPSDSGLPLATATFSSTLSFTTPTPTQLSGVLRVRDESESTPTELFPSAITNSNVSASSTPTQIAFAETLTTSSSSSSTKTTASTTATTTAASSSSSSSMTTIIGVVVGVLGSLLIIGLITYLILDRKKKAAQHNRLMNEKPRTPAYIPPPTANGGQAPVRPAPPTGPGSTLRNAPAVPAKDFPSQSPSQKENNPANPFGSSAEQLHAPESANPFADPAAVAPGAAISTPGAVAVPLKRKASRRDGPNKLDLTLPMPPRTPGAPGSPTGSDYSVSLLPEGAAPTQTPGSVAIAAAGGPATSATHRVKLEFQPTLEDELELQTGQLVRLLHEYDDGWALVIRLDRSAQGVVPRTCLSAQPVKPRPANGKPPVAMNNQGRRVQDVRPSMPGQAY